MKRQLRIAEDLITYAIKNNVKDKCAFARTNFSPSLNVMSNPHFAEQAVEKEINQKKTKLGIYNQFDEYINSKHRTQAWLNIDSYLYWLALPVYGSLICPA